MSPALVLLQHLHAVGVALEVDGVQLKIRGSKPVLTDELLGKIRAHKPILLALLSTPTAPTSVSLCDALPHNTPEAAVLPSVLSATVRQAPFSSLDLGPRSTRLRTSGDVADLAARISAAPAVALCVEGDKYEVLDRPRFLHVGLPDGSVWTVDLVIGLDIGPVAEALSACPAVVHDGVGDLARLAHHHAIRPAVVRDTFIAAKLLDGGREQHDRAFELEVLADRYLGAKLPPTPAYYSTAPTSFPSEAWSACTRVLLSLADKLDGELSDANLLQIARLEFELLPIVVGMMLAGLRVDRVAWEELLLESRSKVRALAPRVMQQLGLAHLELQSLVLSSLQKMGLSVEATDKDTLAPYAHIPVVANLIELRHHEAFAKSVGSSISKAVARSHDGRVRVELRQLGTVTGRFTTRRLNFLGTPKDDRVRRAFVPADGCVFVVGDYAACQMRIAAAYTGEQNLLDLFRRGGDPHVLTASLVLGKPEDAVTQEERTRAKVVNFGFTFGMGVDAFIAYALSNYRIVFTREEAATFRAKFLGAYPAIARWHDATAQPASEALASAGGRVRYFHGDDFCARLASPIQATEADGIKTAMIRLAPKLQKYGARILLCVHDELLLETPKATATEVRDLLEREMRESMQELVPEVLIKVDTSVRLTWAKADEILDVVRHP
jgi:DNA polymerase-1